MEDIKKKSSKTTSSRAHPYKSKKAAAKQAAKDKLKGTIFVDALPPQEDEKVVVTSEHFKTPEEPAPPLEEMKSLMNKVGKSSGEKKELVVVEEGEVTPEGTGDYPYTSLDELLYNVEASYPCPIHYTQIEELKSKKEDSPDVFLRCQESPAPPFAMWKIIIIIIIMDAENRGTAGSLWIP